MRGKYEDHALRRGLTLIYDYYLPGSLHPKHSVPLFLSSPEDVSRISAVCHQKMLRLATSRRLATGWLARTLCLQGVDLSLKRVAASVGQTCCET